MNSAIVNPHYASRLRRSDRIRTGPFLEMRAVRTVTIGRATLHLADCFNILPTLERVDAVVTDPPFHIGFTYRSHDDSPRHYDDFMRRLVPALDRVTDGGPCFVWQSPLTAHRWHTHFPQGWRIVAACKLYPSRSAAHGCRRSLSWDPILFFSRRTRLERELPRDWDVADMRSSDGYRGDNVHPCPRPLSHARFLVDHVRAESILDPFMGSGTTGVAAILAGKRFVGIERDPVYFECAVRRIEEAHDRVQ